MASITKITAISKNNTVIGGIYKNNNADTFKSQPSLLLVLVNTFKLYKIKKIVQLKNNITTLDNTIDVKFTNSSNDKNNSTPLFSKDGGAKNDLRTIRIKGMLVILILHFLDVCTCIYL